jgi:hypothetical protein
MWKPSPLAGLTVSVKPFVSMVVSLTMFSVASTSMSFRELDAAACCDGFGQLVAVPTFVAVTSAGVADVSPSASTPMGISASTMTRDSTSARIFVLFFIVRSPYFHNLSGSCAAGRTWRCSALVSGLCVRAVSRGLAVDGFLLFILRMSV